MASPKTCLLIGAGGMAGGYVRNFFPTFGDRLHVVGLVDVNSEPLQASGDFLGLPKSARFSDMETAFAKVEADFCCIVIPPAVHKKAVLLATEAKMDILSEKPIADTWEDCAEIYRAVKSSGVKMQVVQNYRYNATMRTFKQVLCDEVLGPVNYIMGRFAADYRRRGAWGMFRHEIPHSLLVEGSVHHFDMLRNLSGANCEYIAGWDWNPHWSSFDGESSGMFVAKMTNGIVTQYEGNCNEVGVQNIWHRELYRAECAEGAAVIDSDGIVRLWRKAPDGAAMSMEEVPLVQPEYQGHVAVVDQFLRWLENDEVPETVIDDNIHSAAMLFAAIEASENNCTVNVLEKVSSAQG